MKRIPVAQGLPTLLATLMLLVAAGAGAQGALDNQNQLLLDLQSLYTKQELDQGVYVGSEFCLACHPDKATWRDTKHAVALRRPLVQYSLVPGQGVVADYDGNGVDDFRQGLDFNQISSVFNRYKPNAPKLSVADGVYYITIGGLRMRVVATQGGTGDWKQRYLLAVPVASGGRGGVSLENYVSPVQYNEVPGEYAAYNPEYWYDGSNRPKFGRNTSAAALAGGNGGTFSKQCIGCHTTGVRGLSQTPTGEWFFDAYVAVLFAPDDPSYFDYNRDGLSDLVNVGCESCHGPGSKHVLAGGDPEQIVNPDDLATTQSNEVCGQCHSRVKSVPRGTHDWPYDDARGRMWLPGRGEPLSDLFTDAGARWPDDINSRLNHQQYFDFLASEKPSFPFHPVRCSECHDPHGGTTNEHQLRDVLVEDGLEIPTRVDDDSLCLSCHAGFGPFADLSKEMIADYDANRDAIAEVVSVHSNHPFAPERRIGLSRCVLCHMPKIANSAVDYDIASHSFEAIPPQKNLMYQAQGGMPDSCSASCHSIRVNVFDLGITDDIGVWDKAFDRRSARQLRRYFGPDGIWFDTTDTQSQSFKALESSARPGEASGVRESEVNDH